MVPPLFDQRNTPVLEAAANGAGAVGFYWPRAGDVLPEAGRWFSLVAWRAGLSVADPASLSPPVQVLVRLVRCYRYDPHYRPVLPGGQSPFE